MFGLLYCNNVLSLLTFGHRNNDIVILDVLWVPAAIMLSTSPSQFLAHVQTGIVVDKEDRKNIQSTTFYSVFRVQEYTLADVVP